MERSKQNKHVVCDEDNDVDCNVDNGDDDNVKEEDEDFVVNGDDSADKHLAHLPQAADCCLMERNKQNKHVVCDKDNDVDDGVDNGKNEVLKKKMMMMLTMVMTVLTSTFHIFHKQLIAVGWREASKTS
eukprot:31682-Ditylum_brightwellii.AAC.1